MTLLKILGSHFIIVLCVAIFIAIKFSTLNFPLLSDSYVHFYTAESIIQGKLLYKDIFYTNLPLFPLIALLYKTLILGNIRYFNLTASIEASIITLIIYTLVFKESKSKLTALLSSLVYLFSFVTLTTVDGQSGVLTASLFAILSYYFLLGKKYTLVGILLGLSILTKAYFAVVVVPFMLFLFLKKERKPLLKLTTSFTITILIILAPFLLFSLPDFLKDILSYSLMKKDLTSKFSSLGVWLIYDALLMILLTINAVRIRRDLLLGLICLSFTVFFLLYQSVFFIYLNIITPFLCISLPKILSSIQGDLHYRRVITVCIFLYFIFPVSTYLNLYNAGMNYLPFDKLNHLIKVVSNENPSFLYGTPDLAPAVSYVTGIPLFYNIIDTNDAIYKSGILDSKKLSKEAARNKTIILTYGANYANLKNINLNSFADTKILTIHCKVIESIPVKPSNVANVINVFKCF